VPGRTLQRIPFWLGSGFFFLALPIFLLSDVLLSSDPSRVISFDSCDIVAQFYPWYDFGFDEISQGRFPLWSPHQFGGAPFFGTIQPALLYPINWLHLLMPTARAINWSVAIHLAMAGWFTAIWLRRLGISAPAALAGGTVFMLSGPFFLRIQAGHVATFAAGAWMPAVFLCLEEIKRSRWRRGWALGALVVGAQCLAGYPQFVYLTAIGASAWWLIGPRGQTSRWVTGVRFASMYATGLLIASVQLLPAIDVSGESTRAGQASLAFSSNFSVPPAEFVSLFTPFAWGDNIEKPYLLDGLLWEQSLYFGAAALAVSLCALSRGTPVHCKACGVVAVLCIILAMGRYTPVLGWAWHTIPGLSLFRAPSRFAWVASILVALLCGTGIDTLARNRKLLWLVIAPGILVAILAGWILTQSSDWDFARRSIESARQSATLFSVSGDSSPSPVGGDLVEPDAAQRYASTSGLLLAAAGGLILLISLLRFATAGGPGFAWLAALIICGELIFSARHAVVWTASKLHLPVAISEVLSESSQTKRRVDLATQTTSNLATLERAYDIWGYDPLMSARWTDLIEMVTGKDLDGVSRALPVAPSHMQQSRLLAMIRASPQLTGSPSSAPDTQPAALATLEIRRNFQVESNREQRLKILSSDAFDPARDILLEQPPLPLPRLPSPADSPEPEFANVLASESDSLDLDIHLNSPAIILVTDAYARGWRVRSIHPSRDSRTYAVVPANHALRAIALPAGSHRLRLEYAPSSFKIGLALSAVGLTVTLLVGGAGKIVRSVGRRHLRSNRLT